MKEEYKANDWYYFDLGYLSGIIRYKETNFCWIAYSEAYQSDGLFVQSYTELRYWNIKSLATKEQIAYYQSLCKNSVNVGVPKYFRNHPLGVYIGIKDV